MKCPNCNKEVSPEWEICPYCKYEPVKCPNCDSGWLPLDAKFCPSCGCALDSEGVYEDDAEETITCPKCGSTDVFDDRTGTYQFECKDCGHFWGDEEDEDKKYEGEEQDDEVDKCTSSNTQMSFDESYHNNRNLEIEKKVKAIIIDILGVEESQVTNDANFVVDLDADEFDTVELIFALEKEFSIMILDEDTKRIADVSDLVKYVQSKCK